MQRTDEERKLFRDDRFTVLAGLTNVRDYEPKTDKYQGAIIALVGTLEECLKNGTLVNICGSLARFTLEQSEVADRKVILEDIAILKTALDELQEIIEGPKEKRLKDTKDPKAIAVRKALSRVNPVELFYFARYGGGPIWYKKMAPDRNGIPVPVWDQRWFGGIPSEKLPKRTVEIRRGNLIEKRVVPDTGIYPESAEKIFNILKVLEEEQPVVDLSIGGRTIGKVSRAGEADFFRDHLSPRLKEWANKPV